jgi:hypothetical protein
MQIKEIILLLMTILLSGCDTMSRYHLVEPEDNHQAIPMKGMLNRQEVILAGGQATVKVGVSRFNFSMSISLEIDNSGTNSIDFTFSEPTLTGANGKSLPLINFYIPGAPKDKPIQGLGSVFHIDPGQSQIVCYVFDGSPVMGATHISQTEAQRTLHFVSRGLKQDQKTIPIDLVFEQN